MADAYFTGADGDFTPTDVVVDPQLDRRLVAQHVARAIDMGQDEWFVNVTLGVPWMHYFTVRRLNRVTLQADLIAAAMEVPQLDYVSGVEITKVGRNLTANLSGTIQGVTFRATLLASPDVQQVGDDAIYSIVFAFFGVDGIL